LEQENLFGAPGSSAAIKMERYPPTQLSSMQAWNSADILLASEIACIPPGPLAVCHDTFGAISIAAASRKPVIQALSRSQQKAVLLNWGLNKLAGCPDFAGIELHNRGPIGAALLRVPKSNELFEFYLWNIASVLEPAGAAYCGFMTKHFSAAAMQIAQKYFASAVQGRAWKKARVLKLTGAMRPELPLPLASAQHPLLGTISQLPGVFSSGRIDPATQFLLDNLNVCGQEADILDLASGNGVLALDCLRQNPSANLCLIDDSLLAIESSRINLAGSSARFVWDDSLSELPSGSFHLAVSNPPFHLEHENNIEVPLSLFAQVKRVLRPGGRFVLVANKHLNYGTHLSKLYNSVSVVANNDKFMVYQCMA
jgi:23S rRNA (guanine1835-N2)-methyltransferase